MPRWGALRDYFCGAPYDGVIWAAWLYVVYACIVTGGTGFNGNMIWFDDHVRMVQVLNWVNGAGWYDRTIMRVNPPEGFHTIWSRIVDIPIASVILALQNFVSQKLAAQAASDLVPLIEVLLLFYASAYFVRPLVGRGRAKLITLFVLFTSCINAEYFTRAGFQAGSASHHPWYILLTLLLFGAGARIVVRPAPRDIWVAGLSIGVLLALGIEALPLIAGFFLVLSFLSWIKSDRQLAASFVQISALGAFIGFVLLPVNQPPDKIFEISFAEPSLLGPILIASAAFYAALQYLDVRLGTRKPLSFFCTAVTGMVIGAALLYVFPQILEGGAAALTPEERMLAAHEHTEAFSLFKNAANTIDYIRMVAPSLMAFLIALIGLRDDAERRRSLLGFYLGLTVLAFAMASIYSRYFHYAQLMACPLLLYGWFMGMRRFRRGEAYGFKNFLVYFALGPLFFLLVPGANYDQEFRSHVLLFPAKHQADPDTCDLRSLAPMLDGRYGPIDLALVPMYLSDRFLYHTNLHLYFLANFPSGNKFIDAKQFYETANPDEAKEIVRRDGITLVFLCKPMYHVSEHSRLTNQLLRGHMTFGQQLVTGEVPNWLKPVELKMQTNYLLFDIDKDEF